jgi:hypothetical protein
MDGIRKTGVYGVGLALAIAALLTGVAAAQSNGLGEKFTATAMDMDRGRTTQLELVVDRWSSEAQRSRLLETLTTKGPEKLLDALQDAPKVGYLRTSTSLGWDLRYAHRTPGEDGGETVVLVTDRPIAFWEAANDTRTLDYPFTVVELHLNRDGEGQGMLSVAAKITRDKKTGDIVIENWGTQSIRLTQVKAEKKTQ